MPVQAVCPNPRCGASLSLNPDQFGRRIFCAKCGTRFEAIDAISLVDDLDTSMGSDFSETSGSNLDLPSNFGRYRIIRKLGQGGMGSVYLAHDTALDRPVALKVPHAQFHLSLEVIERFRRESQAAASFRHPNFCPIYDVGQIDGTHCLAMAYIEGETLGSRVNRARPMPAREAAEIIRQLALALAEAHRKGIIHRDLKPANVMIDRQGALIIMDFGLARRSGTDDADLTRTGAMLGTPAYMSPEQVRGTKHDLGVGTDIYALGVMLYELATGRRPFEGSVTMVIGAILHLDPQPPSAHRPGLDSKLEAVCLKAMAKKVEDRYASMRELAEALREGPPAPPDPGPAVGRPHGRLRVALMAAGALLILMMGLVVYVTTDKGTLRIEGFGPGMEVRVDGKEVRSEKLGEPIVVRSGEHGLIITRGQVLVESPKTFEVRRGQETVVTLELTPAPPPKIVVDPPRPADPPIAKVVEETPKKESRPLDFSMARRFFAEGEARRARKDFEGAMASYGLAIQIDPTYAAAYSRRAAARSEKKDDDGALADSDQAIQIDPNDAFAHTVRGKVWVKRFNYEKALAAFDEAIRIDPQFAPAFDGRGVAWNAKKDNDQAITAFDESIRLDPKSALVYAHRGDAWFDKGDYDQAIRDADESIRLDPDLALAYHNRGYAWFKKEEYEKAIADYDQAIRIDPKYAYAYAGRAEVWLRKKSYDNVIADADEATRVDPDYVSPYLLRGRMWLDRKDYDRAIANFDDALRRDSTSTSALEARGDAWYQKSEYDKALADFNESIRLNPDSGSGYNRRGNVFYSQNKNKEAIQEYLRSISLNPRDAVVYNNLAQAHVELGDYTSAVKAEQKAFDLATGSRKDEYRLLLDRYREKMIFR